MSQSNKNNPSRTKPHELPEPNRPSAAARSRECSVCGYALRRSGRCSNYECTSRLNSKGPSVVSLDDLARDTPPPLFHGRRWGQWTLDVERLCLVFRGEPVPRGDGSGVTVGVKGYTAYLGHYEIDIEVIRQSSQMLDWIFQIRGKGWATARVMKDLIEAFDDILYPQQNLCSNGCNKIIKDPKTFIRHRIATVGKDAPLVDAASGVRL